MEKIKIHHPSRIMAVIVALVVLIALAVNVMRFKVTTDLGLFLPSGQTVLEQVLMGQLDRGSTSNLIFAGIEGDTSENLAKVSQSFADQLGQTEGFVQVLNGATAMSSEDQNWVMDNRYHLTPADLSENLSEEGLGLAMQERLKGLMSPLAALEKKFLARDPTGEILNLLNQWQGDLSGESGPAKANGVWFSQDQSRAVMIIELASGGLDLAGQQQALDHIFQVFETVRTDKSRLVLAGPSVFAVETRDIITADVRFLSILATSLVIIFLLAVFRSLRLLGLILIPIVSGILVACAVVLLAFDTIHGITLAFGITLTGVAVDYPIHFFSHLKGGRENAESSIRNIWKTLALGVLSTIIAYVALVLSEFRGLQQLGVFTVCGLLAAAAVTRWILPLLVPAQLSKKAGLSWVHQLMHWSGNRLSGKGYWSLAVIPLAAMLVLVGNTPLRDLDPDSLSPIGQDRRTQDRDLRGDLGFWYGGKLAVVVASDSETALQRSEQLQEQLDELVSAGAISRFDLAASFLPSQKHQQKQIDAIPDEEELRRRILVALKDSPLRKDIFEKFVAQAQAARSKPLLTVDSLSQSQMGERLKSLLFEQNGLWIAPVLLHGVTDESALQVLNQQDSDTQVLYLNIKQRAAAILGDALDRLVPLLLLGVLVIYILLALAFKSLFRPLLILMPTISAVAVTVAILNVLGISMTLMHMVSLLLIIGLGLDYALFFNRINDEKDEWHTTFKALWVCCFTTVLVFGILIISVTPPLQAIGATVGTGALLCLIFGACWTRRSPVASS
ncbi:MAG: putative exporter [Parasphingorhabdus sp.]|jgi:predicted exporter